MNWQKLLLAAVTVLVTVTLYSGTVSAADARNYNAGRIVDDAVFTNSDTMTVQQIQSFLNSKAVCDTWGSKRSELGGGTRAQWLASKGISTPITCLRDYHEDPSNGVNNYGRAIPVGAISAAQIIYNYSKQFSINPQVILVTLQKENGLITDEWPTPKQYTESMGFGCPDNVAPGAPACNPAYGSFSAQIYQAARHFRGYINNSAGWWVPFNTGNNAIRWSPNASCGSGTVNIQNRSTVALYSYTPYQPNQAAKNAQYGTGDSCSAYGNRNFYMYFNDWFGSTTADSTLVRTIANDTVYLISDNNKYPIGDIDTMNSLRLGNVGFVSQGYLDSKQTGVTLKRLIIDKDGTVYYFDVGIKLAFTSCDMVADYGYSCNQAAQLSDWQLQALVTGPNMTSFYKTTSGKSFYIKSGQKREVFDEQSLNAVGLSSAYNVITEAPLSNLTYGQPIIRNNVIVADRNTGEKYVKDQGSLIPVTNETREQTWAGQITAQYLDNAGLSQAVRGTGQIKGMLRDSTSDEKFILTPAGKMKLSNPVVWPDTFTNVSSEFINTIPTSGSVSAPYLIKSPLSSTVYFVDDQTKRGLTAWSDVQKINSSSTILTIPDSIVNNIAEGRLVLNQGGLVKAPNNATAYYVDGLNNLYPISSFTVAQELGIPLTVGVMPEATINSYARSGATLKSLVSCGGNKYVAAGGKLNKVTSALDTVMGVTGYQALAICPAVPVVDLVGNFFIDSYGTIYRISDGVKHPIGNWNKYLSLGGTPSNTIRVGDFVVSEIPTGALLD